MTEKTLIYLDKQLQCNVDGETRLANMASALSRGLPVFSRVPEHDRRLAIVGSGPSASDHIEDIRNFNGDIWTVNGSLDWLSGLGIRVDGYVMIDAKEEMKKFLQHPPKETTYYIASTCHPAVLDCLTDRNVILWHMADGDALPPKGQGMVGGGPTVMTRAPLLAYVLGYRDVMLFGADSSFRAESHAYGHVEYPWDIVQVNLEGRAYFTVGPLIHNAAYLVAIKEWFAEHGARLDAIGDGLGPDLMRAEPRSVESLMA